MTATLAPPRPRRASSRPGPVPRLRRAVHAAVDDTITNVALPTIAAIWLHESSLSWWSTPTCIRRLLLIGGSPPPADVPLALPASRSAPPTTASDRRPRHAGDHGRLLPPLRSLTTPRSARRALGAWAALMGLGAPACRRRLCRDRRLALDLPCEPAGPRALLAISSAAGGRRHRTCGRWHAAAASPLDREGGLDACACSVRRPPCRGLRRDRAPLRCAIAQL